MDIQRLSAETGHPPKQAQDAESATPIEEHLLHAQKMESLGALAGGMAHDMNNVLASIMAVASAMDAEMPEDHPYADDVKDILRACRRGSKLTRGLLSFARRGRVNMAPIDLNEVVTEVTAILRRTVSKGIEIRTRLSHDMPKVMADPDQINQVLMNICLNGVYAMADQGRLTITTELVIVTDETLWRNPDGTKGPHVRIAIRDTGPGIPTHLHEKVFEPFFSTKPKGKGTGLGLAMAYGTIKKHRGFIQIDENYHEGTAFLIDLPLADAATSSIHQTADPLAPISKSNAGCILLVDDEDLFRTSAKRILEKLGYRVICARNGQEALSLFGKHQKEIDLVILDMIMPVLGGRETFIQLRKRAQHLPVIIASGFTEEENLRDVLKDPYTDFISKPFDLRSLSAALPKITRGSVRA